MKTRGLCWFGCCPRVKLERQAVIHNLKQFSSGTILKTFFHYHVFGWHIQSDIALPCQPRLEPGIPDCVLETLQTPDFSETTPAFSSDELVFKGKIITVWKNANQDWRLEYHIPEFNYRMRWDVGNFGRRIWVRYNRDKYRQNIPFKLLGSVLAACLWQSGKVCLHGGVVVSANTGLMVMGESKAGKSSTLGALMQRGCQILTEDVVVLSPNCLNALRGPDYLRLWSDSALALGFDPNAMGRVFQPESFFGGKRYLELPSDRFGQDFKSARISQIFILAGRGEATKPTILPLTPQRAVPHLMNNLYRGVRFDLESRRDLAFSTCVDLAHQCRVSLLRVPANLERLPELATSLLEAAELVA